MPGKQPKYLATLKNIAVVFIVAILLSPIFVYIYTFGTYISDKHQRWGEMGSAMSGIYTPILAVLTLLVLITQVRLQSKLNSHIFNQSFIEEARSDVRYTLEHLKSELEKISSQQIPVGQFIVQNFKNKEKTELLLDVNKTAARQIDTEFASIAHSWAAINVRLSGLNKENNQTCIMSYNACRVAIMSVISYRTCVALDNYLFALSQNIFLKEFIFSSKLK